MMRTSNAEMIEQLADVLLVTIRPDAVRVDVGAGIVAEAGDVSRRQSGADVDQKNIIIVAHQSPHSVNANRT